MNSPKPDKYPKINFSKRTIESLPLPPKGRRARYYDEKTNGLLIQITGSGARTYWVRKKVDGISQWERIGDVSIFSVEQARMRAYEINGRLADRKCKDIRTKTLREEPTLQTLFDEYIERHAKENRKTWKDMEANFKRYVVNFHISGRRSLASLKVCDITSGMAHDLHKKLKHDGQSRAQAKNTIWLQTQNKRLAWIEKQLSKINKELDEGPSNFARSEKLQERKTNLLNWKEKAELKLQELNSPKTKLDRQGSYSANRTIQLLKAVVNCGKKFKSYTGDNPFDGITLYKEEKRKRFLTDNEAARLFDVLDKLKGDTRDIITLLLLTGARKSNVLSLRWEEICWDTQTWTIPETKNGESQTIPLGPEERTILLARWNTASQAKMSEYVFPGNGATGHIVFPRRSWVSVCRQANLKNFTMHDLRRSLAAKMASSNVNIAIVKGVMGHKDIKTTLSVYAHTTQSAQLEARLAAHDAWRESNKNRPRNTNTG
ncbi:MAG: hypothetical protein EKK48_12385 [Candidatus Melainabacteria bacterium]|nr:MAG: hypothetical protein EKK48_12385 [Candidatus Melainabacteria bacterium]